MLAGLAAAAAAAALAASPGYIVNAPLTAAAGVETRCYTAWPYGTAYTGWYGPAAATGPVAVIGLHPRVCHALRRAIYGPRRVGGYQPIALHTFAHEVAHHLGATHESSPDADKLGCRILPGLMRRLEIPRRFSRNVMRELEPRPC
ncbi:MAG: hypothetical protein KJ058_00640 [Thermoanaerobaculia bacterium]|nr:hypothetical protein [Thermoanaerobaculia bacterium]